MRKVTLILLVGIAVAAVASVTPLSWKATTIDLGQVTAGSSRSIEFEFTNENALPVTILEAKGSCGCTNVRFPAEAIQPGASASISATFASGKVGSFRKNIRIKTSNEEEYTYLYFTGEVVE